MNVKQLYEKMIDYRQFGIVLLAAGAFFYLGVILPSTAVMADKYISMGASAGFLLLSALFFKLAKNCQGKLAETEEGQEYMMSQKRP